MLRGQTVEPAPQPLFADRADLVHRDFRCLARAGYLEATPPLRVQHCQDGFLSSASTPHPNASRFAAMAASSRAPSACCARSSATSRVIFEPLVSTKPATPAGARWWTMCCTQAKLALPFGGAPFGHRPELGLVAGGGAGAGGRFVAGLRPRTPRDGTGGAPASSGTRRPAGARIARGDCFTALSPGHAPLLHCPPCRQCSGSAGSRSCYASASRRNFCGYGAAGAAGRRPLRSSSPCTRPRRSVAPRHIIGRERHGRRPAWRTRVRA